MDGREAGRHRGGFVPFTLDVTGLLGQGGEIAIEVLDPTDRGLQCRGKQSLEPGGIWYTAASGIWGTVWLEPVPDSYIASVAALPDLAGKRLLVEARIALPAGTAAGAAAGTVGGPALPRLSGLLKEGALVVATSETGVCPPADGTGGFLTALLEFPVLRPRPWSPDSPFLYSLELELDSEGATADRADSYAAMRSVAIGPDAAGRPRILLNGEPLFNNAVLDQGYWPEGVFTAPSDAALLSDIKAAKALGFNTIRKHAKVECERWYWHCDREGVLVWQDIPSGGAPMTFLHSAILGFAGIRLRDDRGLPRFGRSDAEGRADFERETEEIMAFLRHFPSIVAWVPFNEGWGQFESRRIAARVAALDPTRIVDAVSGWYDRGAGHLASRHGLLAQAPPPRRAPRPRRGHLGIRRPHPQDRGAHRGRRPPVRLPPRGRRRGARLPLRGARGGPPRSPGRPRPRGLRLHADHGRRDRAQRPPDLRPQAHEGGSGADQGSQPRTDRRRQTRRNRRKMKEKE